MAIQEARAASATELAGTHVREELSARAARRPDGREIAIIRAVAAALNLAVWALVVVGISLVI
jgi:hypothetical protein